MVLEVVAMSFVGKIKKFASIEAKRKKRKNLRSPILLYGYNFFQNLMLSH
jgi:hypothetical protein